jgi:hypothetical protein
MSAHNSFYHRIKGMLAMEGLAPHTKIRWKFDPDPKDQTRGVLQVWLIDLHTGAENPRPLVGRVVDVNPAEGTSGGGA